MIAANAAWRKRVVVDGRDAAPSSELDQAVADPPQHKRRQWADLMHRAFGYDLLSCPNCGGKMQLLACIMERSTMFECEHPAGTFCNPGCRYITQSGERLPFPDNATLLHLGYGGHALIALETPEPDVRDVFVIDGDGVLTEVATWSFPFAEAIRATPDGFLMVDIGSDADKARTVSTLREVTYGGELRELGEFGHYGGPCNFDAAGILYCVHSNSGGGMGRGFAVRYDVATNTTETLSILEGFLVVSLATGP